VNRISHFWQELKRRKVIKVIAMYAGAAYVLIELANNVVEPLNLPVWTPRLVILIALIGFPIAVVLSWIFDLTPDGIKRTEAERSTTLTQDTDKKPRRRLKISDIVIMGLFFAVCILLYPKIFAKDKFKEFRDSDGRILLAERHFGVPDQRPGILGRADCGQHPGDERSVRNFKSGFLCIHLPEYGQRTCRQD
jgi:hypothetical protein